MNIIKTYGRYPDFDFTPFPKLQKVLDGTYGVKNNRTQKENVCAINSFLTLWLITLPEKFEEWYNYCHEGFNLDAAEQKPCMNLNETPDFPKFRKGKHVMLLPNPVTRSYSFLPISWNLLTCFKHFLSQKEEWLTPSIEYEFQSGNNQNKTAASEEKPAAEEVTGNVENQDDDILQELVNNLDGEAEVDVDIEQDTENETAQYAVAQEAIDEENETRDDLEEVIQSKSKKRSNSQTRRSSSRKKKPKDLDTTEDAPISALLADIDKKIGEIIPIVNTIERKTSLEETMFDDI